VVSHRAGLDPALVQAVADALLAMEGDEEGREVLKTFKTARFDRFPESVDEVFARVEAILARLPELRTN
jgi:ABC-type phosphate/phosphonate transport system substrate-binding protein